MRVASFFAGIGGFDLGFERARCKVIFQCERDSFCQAVLRKHWPDVALHGDIRTLVPENIPEADIWCGGFPCQDVSLANQKKRKGLDGERSGLFDRFAELASHFPPEWIVLENVPGLLNSRDGEDFRHVLHTLDALGYFVAWRILDAQYFGTPQRRRRVFVVGSYQWEGAAGVLFGDGAFKEMVGAGETACTKPRSAAQEGVPDTDLFTIQHGTIGRKPDWSGPQGKGYRNDGKSYTLDSRGSADVICETNAGFRVREAPRFRSELDSRRVRAVGNAVCVNVSSWIASRITGIVKVKTGKLRVTDEEPCSTKELASLNI